MERCVAWEGEIGRTVSFGSVVTSAVLLYCYPAPAGSTLDSIHNAEMARECDTGLLVTLSNTYSAVND